MNELIAVNGQGLPTILGENPARFPIGGKIRAGIKVLTKAAAANERAREIYQRGVEAGLDFEGIEREIAQAAPELKNPLTPKNVPYFTVRRGDFAHPELAERILELYGEDRGEGVKRLYRFPVVFPSDAWQAILPHGLACYGASGLRYWSEYSRDGRERRCMGFERVPVDGNGKRIVRLFGGRKRILRAENDGRCDPEACREYQARQCNLTGRFIFLIPGIPSIRAIELPTNSFYSMAAAREALETVALMRGGRIAGFLDGKTTFWIAKELKDVPMIGDDGEPRRVQHWLIKLEAPVDLTRLLRVEDEDTRRREGERAVTVLTGVGTPLDGEEAGSTAPGTGGEAEPPPVAGRGNAVVAPSAPGETHAMEVSQPPDADAPQAEPSTRSTDDALGQIFEWNDGMQIPREIFERYARKRYGVGWLGNANGIKRVRSLVEASRHNPRAFLDRIEAELDLVG
jgi:recombination directionality factor gp3-like protein